MSSNMMSASAGVVARNRQSADLGPAVSQMTAMLSEMRDELRRDILAEIRADLGVVTEMKAVFDQLVGALGRLQNPQITVAAPPPAQVTVAAAVPADVTVNPSFTVPPADIKLIPGPKGTKRVTFVRSMNGEITGATVEEI